jgi:hypothetical protein
MISVTSVPGIHHLEKYHLVDLSMQAKAIGYRIRGANDWSFGLEYQGELGWYQGTRKAFTTNEPGKQAARAYLQARKSEIERLKLEQEAQNGFLMENNREQEK